MVSFFQNFSNTPSCSGSRRWWGYKETNVLLQLAIENRPAIRSVGHDKETVKLRDAAWAKISSKYRTIIFISD